MNSGIAQQSVNFALGNGNTNVKEKCIKTLSLIEDNLKGEFMNGVHCLCSPEFFSALTGHAKVEKAFETWQQGAILINDVRRGFTYAGITFEEYRGQATDIAGTVRRFIAPGEAHAFPLGTVDTFASYFAPADFNETVNTLGLSLYAKQAPVRLNVAPICTPSPTRCRCATDLGADHPADELRACEKFVASAAKSRSAGTEQPEFIEINEDCEYRRNASWQAAAEFSHALRGARDRATLPGGPACRPAPSKRTGRQPVARRAVPCR